MEIQCYSSTHRVLLKHLSLVRSGLSQTVYSVVCKLKGVVQVLSMSLKACFNSYHRILVSEPISEREPKVCCPELC